MGTASKVDLMTRVELGGILGTLELIQAAQTAALLTVAVAVIYALVMLRNELRQAGAVLRGVVNTQAELTANTRRAWERIDAVEARMSVIEERIRDPR
jgi:ribosomal protein S9